MPTPAGNRDPARAPRELYEQIEQRFGVLPGFYRLTPQSPELAPGLWQFARSAYLDNPLEPLFKERLFVYLSGLGAARYCSARHAAFLLGLGRQAGDARAPAASAAELVQLLQRPLASGAELESQLAACARCEAPLSELPAPGSALEEALFACAGHAFLNTAQAGRCLAALRRALGEPRAQQLALLLAFIRAAHAWSELHPELALEEDVAQLLDAHAPLAESLRAPPAATAEAAKGTDAATAGARQLVESLQRELAAESARRRRAEEALRQRSAQLGALLEHGSLGVCLIDVQGRIRELHPRGAALLGGAPEPLGRDFAELARQCVAAPDAEALAAGLGQSLQTGAPSSGSASALAATAATPSYEWRIERIPAADGGFAALCSWRERSDERALRAALAQSEQRLHALGEVLCDLPWSCDAEGHFAAPQPAWSAFTGQSDAELADLGWLDALHPDDREPIRASWELGLHTGTPHEARVRLWHEPTGEYRHTALRAAPLLGPDGELRGWVGACTDVTEQHAAEQALAEASRRKDEFLATLAHELRNPLAPIRSCVQIMRLASGDPDLVEQARQTIERQLAHLVRLLDDLLDVSRLRHGKIELRRERVSLAVAVESALESSRPLLDALGHELSVELPAHAIWLHADLTRLAQVLGNLLDNAAKYTPAGGRIWLSAEEHGRELILRVRDSGIGISTELLPRIFELFSQEGVPGDRSHGGLGIGLVLVKSLVELHGGQISVSSAGRGLGSEFSVRLPSLPSPQHAPAHETRRAPLASTADPAPIRKLLVVDDNRDAAGSLAMLLEIMGHQVQTAHDGPAALVVAREFEPDYALLDIGMPGMNGYELAQRIRSDPKLQGIALIAVTGWGQDEDRRRSREAGFDAHLVKPVGPEALQALLSHPELAFADSSN